MSNPFLMAQFLSYFLVFLYAVFFVGLAVFAVSLIRHLGNIGRQITLLGERFAPASPPKEDDTGLDHGTLRLQACERFTLMLERISVPNLLLRIAPDGGTTAREYTAQLLLTIRQEVEYNITQQIYVSDSLWSIITQSRDNISLLIAHAAEGAESSAQIANRLRNMSSGQAEDPVAVAQGAIRREAASVLTK